MLFGRKKKTEGRRLSEVLTKQERSVVRRYLSAMSVIGGTKGIRDACAGLLPVVETDDKLVPGVIQGLINICNTIESLTADITKNGVPIDDAREARGIAKKLQTLL